MILDNGLEMKRGKCSGRGKQHLVLFHNFILYFINVFVLSVLSSLIFVYTYSVN